MSFLSRLFSKKEREGETPARNKVLRAISKGRCPDCGGVDFLEGPSAGFATNYQCDGCGSRFNIARFGHNVIIAERI